MEQWFHDPKLEKSIWFIESRESHADEATYPDFAWQTESFTPFEGVQDQLKDLSVTALLEGLVAVKTSLSMLRRIETQEDEEYLYENKDALGLLPEALPPIYNLAKQIYDKVLVGKTTYDYAQWPKNYLGSNRMDMDTAFVLLADIALHIPPFEFADQRIESDLNTPLDFDPVYRFCRAIGEIYRNGGFPPSATEVKHIDMRNYSHLPQHEREQAVSRKNEYYRVLFNFLAEKAHWPTLQETNLSWIQKLATMKRTRGCASDGYRFRMLVQRDLTPTDIALGDAISTCGLQGVPIFHLTPTGFKTFHLTSGYWMQGGEIWTALPLEEPDMNVYNTFIQKLPPWEDAPPTPTRFDDRSRLKRNVNNSLKFNQEVIYRALCRSVQDAVLHQSQLVCPFAKGGCTAAVPSCGAIKNLDNIPKRGCALREWATLPQTKLQLDRIRWS